MALSLALPSNFIAGSKVVLSHPVSLSCNQRSSKFNIVSCRAATKMETTASTNFYKVLSLQAHENLSSDEIKKAYRTMALKYHPDVSHPSRKEESARMFVELHKAYKVLSDPISRKKYDYEMGMTKFDRTYSREVGEGSFSKDRWEEQLCNLRKRSTSNRMSRKEESWGSRLRAQHRK